MEHLSSQAGIALREGGLQECGPGTWRWLAGRDPRAPPGALAFFCPARRRWRRSGRLSTTGQ
eukprot:7119271-Pyramimonas_sp.AAC.1